MASNWNCYKFWLRAILLLKSSIGVQGKDLLLYVLE